MVNHFGNNSNQEEVNTVLWKYNFQWCLWVHDLETIFVMLFFKTQSNNIYYVDIARVYRMAITSYSTHLFTTKS